MVFIFTALYQEAGPIIKRLRLKKRVDRVRFQQFVSEDYSKLPEASKRDERGVSIKDIRPEILLVVTGVGIVNAAAAVSAVLTEYDAGPSDEIISFGTAASLHRRIADEEESSVYIINKILDKNTGRSFYPDMLVKSEIKEAALITGSKVLSEEDVSSMDKEEADYDLYDMEASSVYQAANFYVGPHQMSFLRVATDSGTGDKGPKALSERVTRAVERHVDEITEHVEKFGAISRKRAEGMEVFDDKDLFLVEKIIGDAHFSKVMQDQFVQYLKYAALSGTDWKGPAEKMYETGMIPTIDKRKGKKVLDGFRNIISE